MGIEKMGAPISKKEIRKEIEDALNRRLNVEQKG